MPLNPLLQELRRGIYVQPFSSINFGEHLNTVAPTDIKRPTAMIVKVMNHVLRVWEVYLRPSWLHRQASDTVRDLVRREDDNTSYNDPAPVNKAFQMTAVYFMDGKDSATLARHRENLPTYLWQSDKGMTSCGTNGVQVWDTAFTVLAIVEAGLAQDHRFQTAMARALDFLDVSQLRENLAHPYRQRRKGGWTFSTKDNRYIVSDCSA
jgi:lanosterol synthase